MNLQHYNEDWVKIEDDAYIWRYMSFERIIDMLNGNTITFSRLDTFDDKLEGLSQKLQNSKMYMQNVNADTNNSALECEFKLWQLSNYSTCWHLTENSLNHHESFAMWNLYTKDQFSFVLKIKLSAFLRLLKESFIDLNTADFDFCNFGKVEYLPLNHSVTQPKINTQPFMPSLVKHLSFKHEQEFRVILKTKNIDINAKKWIHVKLIKPLSDFGGDLEIFSHPQMHSIAYETFRDKFQELGFNLKKSALGIFY